MQFYWNLLVFLDQEPVNNIDIVHVLQQVAEHIDGGYILMGALENGQTFICRDPAGIRSAHFLATASEIAVASERAALATVYTCDMSLIQEIKAGHVLIIQQDSSYEQRLFTQPLELRQCTFKRIYFSRANDVAIIKERKSLHDLYCVSSFESVKQQRFSRYLYLRT